MPSSEQSTKTNRYRGDVDGGTFACRGGNRQPTTRPIDRQRCCGYAGTEKCCRYLLEYDFLWGVTILADEVALAQQPVRSAGEELVGITSWWGVAELQSCRVAIVGLRVPLAVAVGVGAHASHIGPHDAGADAFLGASDGGRGACNLVRRQSRSA